MILILGTNTRETEAGSGRFHCPRCRTQRAYVQKRVGLYFTLFFIPLFRVKTLGDVIECQTCHERYGSDVLDYRPPSEMDRLMATVRADLAAGMPLQMARQKLINAGIHEVVAASAVADAAGAARKTCPQCALDYAGTIDRCTNCGATLVPSTASPARVGEAG